MSRRHRASLEFLGRAGPGVLLLLPRGPDLPFWGSQSGLCPPGEGPRSAGSFQPCGIFSRRMLNCSQTAAARGRGGSGTSALVSGASSSCHGVTYLDRPVPGAVPTRGRCSDFVFELPPLFEACLSEQRVLQSQVTETEEEAEDA